MQRFLANQYNQIYLALGVIFVLYFVTNVNDLLTFSLIVNAFFIPLAGCQGLIAIKNEKYSSVPYFYKSSTTVFLIGLTSSWIGSFFVCLQSEAYFMIGMATFFVSHIAYTVLMLNIVKREFKVNFFVVTVSLITIFLIVLAMFFLWPYVHAIKIHLFVYCFALFLLCVAAANTAFSQHVQPERAIMLMCGAFSFIIFDTVVATTTFLLTPTLTSKFFITLTYIIAQVLLVRGITEKRASTSNKNNLFAQTNVISTLLLIQLV